MDLRSKLEEIEKSYKEIETKMADPAVANDPAMMQDLGRKHSEMATVVDAFMHYEAVQKALDGAKELASGGDPEMAEMAKEEILSLEDQLPKIEHEIQVLLLPKDINDDKNVMIEIRGGAGGDEAALFAADLYRMYTMYAERERWGTEIVSSNETGIGGYKEVVFRVTGVGAFSRLKYESGVHRVQRVPETEASGRIHTSTATVAVLPEAADVDVDIRSEDLKIDTYRSSGAGGQHVNKTDSAIRITHLPTGIVCTCQDERSQIKNKAKAMQYLRTKLYDMELQKRDSAMAAKRKGQIGTGDRSERIRTYNFPQNRVTDHRINVTLYKLDQILNGDMEELISLLVEADQAEKLKDLTV